MEGTPTLQLRDCVGGTCSHSDAKGNLQRPSGKRHSLTHSVDHLSFDMFDQVPSNIPESSFPARFIFEDNGAAIRMTIKG